MTTKEGFECFKLYLALQRHFSSSYDFHKYKGGVTASADSYKKRNDYFSFEKLAKIVPPDQRVDFFVSHFIDNPKEWIRNMSKTKHEEWKRRVNMLPNTFQIDLEFLYNEGMDKMFKTSGDIPEIHKHAINGEISIESVLVLDSIFPFLDKHKEQVNIPFVWPEYIQKVIKYKPFLEENISKRIGIFREISKKILM